MIPNFKYPTPIDKEVNWDKSKTIMSRTQNDEEFFAVVNS